MSRIDDALATSFRKLVHGDFLSAMPDTNLARRDNRLNLLANEPPRYGISVAVDIDGAVVVNAPLQRAAGPKGRTPSQRLQPACFLLGEPFRRRFPRGPMHPRIGNILARQGWIGAAFALAAISTVKGGGEYLSGGVLISTQSG
jgi:hypothetical protein